MSQSRLIVTTLLALGFMVTALASPKMQTLFNKTYPVPKESDLAKAKCASCHVKGATLNSYGKDVQKAMKDKKSKELTAEILKSVEGLDSDKDGVKNGDELKAGTLPADAKSKPAESPPSE